MAESDTIRTGRIGDMLQEPVADLAAADLGRKPPFTAVGGDVG
jgi:hypothetical protein